MNHSGMFYIHGYLSSPDGAKGSLLKSSLDIKPIKYRDCEPEDLVISSCIDEIKKELKNISNPILIGSSLGGFLAVKTALTEDISTLILLNPAIMPTDVDITKIDDMPSSILKDMIYPDLFQKRIQARIIIFIGTKDTVVPNRWGIEFAKAQEAEVHFLDDDHRLSKNLENLPEMIKKVLL